MIPIFLLLALAPMGLAAPGRAIKAAKLGTVKIKEIISRPELIKPATRGGEFRTQKILVREATASVSAQLKRRAIMGVISALSGNTITLTHQIQKDRTFTVFFDSNTLIKSKSTASSSATLAVGQRIIAVGSLKDAGILAKLIHIIPGKATGVFNRPTASPSASPSATPVLTPTIAPSPTPTASPSATHTPTI